MSIKPIKMLLAASVALPLFAAAAHAAPTITDHNYLPRATQVQHNGSSPLDARASIDVSVGNTQCNYAGGPKLDSAFCH